MRLRATADCRVTLMDLANGMLHASPGLLADHAHRIDIRAGNIFDELTGWHNFLLQTQDSRQACDGVISTYQEDRPLSLRQHLDLLMAGGFEAADVLFKKDIFAIYAGIKSVAPLPSGERLGEGM